MTKLTKLFMLCLFGMISIGASATVYSGPCGDNAQWSLDTTTGLLSITGSGDMADYSSYSDVPWYSYCNSIRSLSVGNQITAIGSSAFEGCSNLTNVTIPNSVTTIGEFAFDRCSSLTSVTIPNSVTSIGEGAFAYCSGLTNVTIGNSVTSIDGMAFYECNNVKTLAYAEGTKTVLSTGLKSITSVTIPNTVTKIGRNAFSGCKGLTSVTIPESVTSIGNSAFYYCSKLTSVTIPNSVTSIGSSAFESCSGLTSVTIPNSVTSIGDRAFLYCSGLKNPVYNNTIFAIMPTGYKGEYNIPQGITKIVDRAFYNCSCLTSVTIPNSVTSIGDYAFSGCSGLTEPVYNNKIFAFMPTSIKGDYSISQGITTIAGGAFSNCSGLTSVEVPNTITSIGVHAFYGCSGLEEIEIPNSVISIGEEAFSGCSNLPITDYIRYADTYIVGVTDKTLTTYKIKEGTKWIGAYAFSYCSSLKSMTIPNSVTSIGSSAFYDCSDLTSMEIPNSVTSIGSQAFQGCKGLTSVTIPNSVTSIGNYAFSGCSGLTSVTIPNSVTSIGDETFGACYFQVDRFVNHSSLNAEANNYWGATICETETDDGLCIKDNCIVKYRGKSTSVTIPNTVIKIAYHVFNNCANLERVNISDLDKWAEIDFGDSYANPLYYAHNLYLNDQLVTEAKLTTASKISDDAFSRCSCLTSIEIPNSVTSIGSYAFSYCSGLISVAIPKTVTSIGSSAFYNCNSLTSVTIPNSVTSIGGSAFYKCSGLTSVAIPKSVTSIGRFAFYYCSSLRNIIADGINAPTTDYSFSSVNDCSLHVPLGSEESYTSNFGEYFGTSNSYGNTIVPYSTYSKNSAGEYSFEVWDASSDVKLSEGADKVYVPVEATVNDLQYKRTFNNTDWQALYVPFELDVKNDLAGFNIYEVSTSSADAINVTLITEGKTSANTPYLIKAKATGEQTIPVSSKTVKVTVENTNSDLSDFEIIGTYEKLKYGDIDGDWYALKGGKFMKAGEGAFLNPYRFYLKRKSSSAKESIDINLNEVTGIEAVQSADKRANNGKHYNLQGIEVNENYNGMIIINGKKYLKK